MNYKLLVLTAAAALALLLAGCMTVQDTGSSGSGSAPDDAQSSQEDLAEEKDVPDQAAGQSLFDRMQNEQSQEPEKVELTVQTNGRNQTVEAVVYTGSRYTIAIPGEDWPRDPNEPQWNAKDNEDVELTIRYYTGKKTEEAVKILQEDEDDYDFRTPVKATLGEAQEATRLSGKKIDLPETDEEETEPVVTEMTVYFVEIDGGCYALLMECPEAEKEHFGSYLTAMADSFALIQPEERRGALPAAT